MSRKQVISKLTAWVLTLLMLISISPTTFMSDFEEDTAPSVETTSIAEDDSAGNGDPSDPDVTVIGDPEPQSPEPTEPSDDEDNSSDPTDPSDPDVIGVPDHGSEGDVAITDEPTDPDVIGDPEPQSPEPTDPTDDSSDPTDPRDPSEPDIEGEETEPDDTDEDEGEEEELEEENLEEEEEPEEIVYTETEIILTDFDELDSIYLFIPEDSEDIEIPFPESVEATLEVIETTTIVIIEEGSEEEETETTEVIIDEYEQVIDEYTESVDIADWEFIGKVAYGEEGSDYSLVPGDFTPQIEGIYRFSSMPLWYEVADDMASEVTAPFIDIIMTSSTDTTIDVSDYNATSGTGWTYDSANQVYKIHADANVKVIGNNTESTGNGPHPTTRRNRIEVAEGATNVKITLDNVSITGLASEQSALRLAPDSDVTLELASSSINTLTSGNGCAGIQTGEFFENVRYRSSIKITGSGELRATGGNNAAGIGGNAQGPSGYITIDLDYGGKIVARVAGGQASGIGGGNTGGCDEIEILGGIIDAQGALGGGNGIGRGPGTGAAAAGSISITGGTVDVTWIGGACPPLPADATTLLTINGDAVVYVSEGVTTTNITFTKGILGVSAALSSPAISANTYVMFGNVTPTDDFEIKTGHSFTFNGQLNLAGGVDMINEGTITVNSTAGTTPPSGSITINNGSELTNKGTITLNANSRMSVGLAAVGCTAKLTNVGNGYGGIGSPTSGGTIFINQGASLYHYGAIENKNPVLKLEETGSPIAEGNLIPPAYPPADQPNWGIINRGFYAESYITGNVATLAPMRMPVSDEITLSGNVYESGELHPVYDVPGVGTRQAPSNTIDLAIPASQVLERGFGWTFTATNATTGVYYIDGTSDVNVINSNSLTNHRIEVVAGAGSASNPIKVTLGTGTGTGVNGADMTIAGGSGMGLNSAIYMGANSHIELVLSGGTYTIRGGASGTSGANGIVGPATSSVTISGTGTLNVGSGGSPNVNNTTGITCGTVNIKSGTVNVSGTTDGIGGTNTAAVNISGGTVNATGGSSGINASASVSITGGTVTATGTGASGSAINSANISIEDAIVRATASGTNSFAIGRSGATVSIDNSYVLAEGASSGINAATLNIEDNSAVFVSHPTSLATLPGTRADSILVTKSVNNNTSTDWFGDEVTLPAGPVTPADYVPASYRLTVLQGRTLNIPIAIRNSGTIAAVDINPNTALQTPDQRAVISVTGSGSVTNIPIQGAGANAPEEDTVEGARIKVKDPATPTPALLANTGQSMQYGIKTTDTLPASDSTFSQINTSGDFSGLAANTQYYIFARSAADGNFSAGPWSSPVAIKTLGYQLAIKDSTGTVITSYEFPEREVDTYTTAELEKLFKIEAVDLPMFINVPVLGTSNFQIQWPLTMGGNDNITSADFPLKLVPGTALEVKVRPQLLGADTYVDKLTVTANYAADLADAQSNSTPVPFYDYSDESSDVALTFTVTPADGVDVSAPVIVDTKTSETSITITRSPDDPILTGIALSSGQTLQYIIVPKGTTPIPENGWIESADFNNGTEHVFTSLTPGTEYTVYARSAAKGNDYKAGDPAGADEATHFYDAALTDEKGTGYSYAASNPAYSFGTIPYNTPHGTVPPYTAGAGTFTFENPGSAPPPYGRQPYNITRIEILAGTNGEVNFEFIDYTTGLPINTTGTFLIGVGEDVYVRVAPDADLVTSETAYTGTLRITTDVTTTNAKNTKTIVFNVPLSVTIDKAQGSPVTLPQPFIGTLTETSIELLQGTSLDEPTGQDIEYAIAYESVPGSGNFNSFLTWGGGPDPEWIDEDTFFKAKSSGGFEGVFPGLLSNTVYRIFARSARSDNYSPGTPSYADATTLYYNATLKRLGVSGDGYSYAANANNTFTFSPITYNYATSPAQDFILENTGYEDFSITGISVSSAGNNPLFVVSAETVEAVPEEIELPADLPITGFSKDEQIKITVAPVTGLSAGTHTCVLTVATNVHPDIGAGKIIVFNVTISITVNKAAGAAVEPPEILTDKTTETSITITHSPSQPLGNGQPIEYAISTTTTPPSEASAWVTIPLTPAGSTHTFTGLDEGTQYYLFARSAVSDNYNTGTPAYDGEATRSYNATLTGPGGAPSYPYTSSANKYVFPDMTYGTATGSYTFTLKNTGSHSFNITQAAITTGSARFTVTSPSVSASTPILVNKDGTQNITVSPVPGLSVGTHTATLTIATDVGSTAGNKSIVFTVALEITVTLAPGADVSAPVITSVAGNSITISPPATMPSSGQVVEYAISRNSAAPASGWVTMTGSSHTFTGLPEYQTHFVFARSQQNTNYSTGAARSTSIRTLDKTLPAATVSYNRPRATNQPLDNDAAFTRFYKDSVTVTVNARDILPTIPLGAASSGISKIEWAVSDTHIAAMNETNMSSLSWRDITSAKSFTIADAGKYYVYLRISDGAYVKDLPQGGDNPANISYLGTGGIVVYEDSSPLTGEMTFYKAPDNIGNIASITLNSNTVDRITGPVRDSSAAVTLQNQPLNLGEHYTVDASGDITFAEEYMNSLAVTGAAATQNSFTIYYNPQGETYDAATAGNDIPSFTVLKLFVIGSDLGLEQLDFPAGGWTGTYTGSPHTVLVSPAEGFEDDIGEITVKYNGSATPPKDAGTYEISIDVSQGFSFNPVTDFPLGVNLVINPKEVYFAVGIKPRGYNASDAVRLSDFTIVFGGLVGDESFAYGIDYTMSGLLYESANAGIHPVTGTVNLMTASSSNTARNYLFAGGNRTSVTLYSTGQITPLTLTIRGFKDFSRPYDGLGRIDISGGLGELYFDGLFGSETASVDISGITSARYPDERVGTNKPVIYEGLFSMDSSSGTADSINYAIAQPVLTGNIREGFTPVNGTHYTTTQSDGEWITRAFEVTAMPGYLVSLSNTDAGPWTEVIVTEESGFDASIVFYVRNKETLEISKQAVEEYMLDNTPPVAFVNYGNRVFNQFLNIISYGVRFNRIIAVEITAYDDLSGVASIEYCSFNTGVPINDFFSLDHYEDLNDLPWRKGTYFRLIPNTTSLLYVRVADNAGNVAIMHDGVVLVYIHPPPPPPERIWVEPTPGPEPEPTEPEPVETPQPTPANNGGFPIVPPDPPGPQPGDVGEVMNNRIIVWWIFFLLFLFLLILLFILFFLLWRRRKREEEEEEGEEGKRLKGENTA